MTEKPDASVFDTEPERMSFCSKHRRRWFDWLIDGFVVAAVAFVFGFLVWALSVATGGGG